jgi:tetratricopeptide (TPR) repeat protein
MRRAFLTIVFVLLPAFSVCSGVEPLANEHKSGLYARSLEYVLRLAPEEVDLGTAALIISEQWSDIVAGRRYLLELDDMALEIRDRLEEKGFEANYRAVGVINEYLFDELGFESVKEASDPDDLFLHSVLGRKRGYCLSLSVLYLSLGERLGVPLYGVVVPSHFFVRYDDGRVRFNIETTSKGGNAPDEHYMEKFKVPEGQDSIYMLNLDKIQTLGCFFNNLGNIYSETGEMDLAMLALERAVQINPSLAESRTNLGNIYLRKERVGDAIDEYKAALEIRGDDAKTHNNLGNAYSKLDWLNEAIGAYLRAVELDPNFVDAYRNLASAYSKSRMYEQAVQWLRRALGLDSKDAELHQQLGDVYRQMGRCEEALFEYKNVLRYTKDSSDTHYGMAVCYNKLGRVDDEIAAYKKALAVEPDMVAALANLGNAYFGIKEYDAAIEQYRRAVQVEPGDGAIRYNLGAAHSNKQEYQQAVIEYRKALELESGMADAHNGLAVAYYQLAKYDLAWEHITTAEELGTEIDQVLLSAIEERLR